LQKLKLEIQVDF